MKKRHEVFYVAAGNFISQTPSDATKDDDEYVKMMVNIHFQFSQMECQSAAQPASISLEISSFPYDSLFLCLLRRTQFSVSFCHSSQVAWRSCLCWLECRFFCLAVKWVSCLDRNGCRVNGVRILFFIWYVPYCVFAIAATASSSKTHHQVNYSKVIV